MGTGTLVSALRHKMPVPMCFMRLPHPAAAHVMVMVVMMTAAHHWIMIVPISHSHPPGAETAERIEEIPRAAIPVKRAGKQAADEGQYNNK